MKIIRKKKSLKLRRIIYLSIIFFCNIFIVFSAGDSLFVKGLTKLGESFSTIFKNTNILITLFFLLYLFIIYIIYKEVLIKIKLFKEKEEISKKLGFLLSLISTLGLFYYGYTTKNLKEFLVIYLGLPGILGIITLNLLIFNTLKEVFNSFIEKEPNTEIKRKLRIGLYGLIIGVFSLSLLIYLKFLASNLQN